MTNVKCDLCGNAASKKMAFCDFESGQIRRYFDLCEKCDKYLAESIIEIIERRMSEKYRHPIKLKRRKDK